MRAEYIQKIKKNILPEHRRMFVIILCSFLPLFFVTSWSVYTSRTPEFSNSLGMKFVFIKGGTFMMGSPPYTLGSENDETQHQVNLTGGFYLQTTEVTQGQWKAVMGNNPSTFSNCGDDCPVENISWDEVQEFIRKLSRVDRSKKYRLPTEAEWEYACRAGTDKPFAFGNCLSTEQANYNGDYPMSGCSKGENRKSPIPVASLEPNARGLYDMHGNVWEWCQDWYGEYTSGKITGPAGPSSGSYRVIRGGNWKREARNCRSAKRSRHAPIYKSHSVGFRLVSEDIDSENSSKKEKQSISSDSTEIENLEAKKLDGVSAEFGMDFVRIEPGSFIMGSPLEEPGRSSDEKLHQVTLTQSIYIQTTEVTQKQWEAVMGNNPSGFSNCGDDCPVENVSWDDVQEFIRRLNNRESPEKYRLPTEAEWEYVCRAGTGTPFPFGRCLSTEQANYNGNYFLTGCSKGKNRKSTLPVASLKANAWGLYDMNGNVWEWCQDWYDEYPSDSVSDPSGPPTGSYRVCRGGSWKHEARKCRSANRNRYAPSFKGNNIGFRLVGQFQF